MPRAVAAAGRRYASPRVIMRPDHPRHLVGRARPRRPCAACAASSASSQSVASLLPGRMAALITEVAPIDQQRAQPFIAGPADAAHALLAAGRMFLRRQPEPGRQVTAGFERRRIDLDRQRQRDDRTDARDGGQHAG